MNIEEIHKLDQEITLLINSTGNAVTDPIMQFFSNIPVWIPLYVAVAAFLFYRMKWKQALVIMLSILITFICCDQFANFIKETVGRLRPCHDDFMVGNGLSILEGKGGMYGFFSGHAANSFGFAISSSIGLKNDRHHKYRIYTWLIFFWALMVSISRIFVGKHYLGDIIVGAVAGSLIALTISFIARAAVKAIDKKEQVIRH